MIQRQLTTTVCVCMTDYAIEEAQEGGIALLTQTVVVIDQQPTVALQLVKTLVGEIQITLRLIASMLSSGDIRLDGQATVAKNTQSMDIGGEAIFSLLAPRNRAVSQIVSVPDDNLNRDEANIMLVVTNKTIPRQMPDLVVRRRLALGVWLGLLDCVTLAARPGTTAYLVRDGLVSSDREAVILQLPQAAGDQPHSQPEADGPGAGIEMVIKGIALTTGDIRIDGAVRHLPRIYGRSR